MTILNPAIHEDLIAKGYTHTHYEADFDNGDAENGSGDWGSPAFDEYMNAKEYICVDETGILAREDRDLELEALEWRMTGLVVS